LCDIFFIEKYDVVVAYSDEDLIEQFFFDAMKLILVQEERDSEILFKMVLIKN
jgi:hypothetical protein